MVRFHEATGSLNTCLVQIQTIAILKQANCFLVGGVSVGRSC